MKTYLKNISDTTGADGYYELNVHPSDERKNYILTILVNDSITKQLHVTPAPNIPCLILIEK